MALHFLLDEHVSPAVADQMAIHHPAVRLTSMQDWEGGAFRGADAAVILRAARLSGLTLVTYDLNTIGPLVKEWAESSEMHAGVVFVDRRTIPQSDIGGLMRALAKLSERESEAEWTNRVTFLRP